MTRWVLKGLALGMMSMEWARDSKAEVGEAEVAFQ
jgi:hypothetical protein